MYNCILNTDIYDFLIDLIPKEEYIQLTNDKKNETNEQNFLPEYME